MNKVILVGRLVRDPEMRQTQSGVAVCSMTVAVDRRFKSASGERETDFISVKAWRQTAEFITQYFEKGRRIGIVGSIQTGKYEKDGRTVYTTDVIADEAYFVDSAEQSQAKPAKQKAVSEWADDEEYSLPFQL